MMSRKIKICVEHDCQNEQTTLDYCRLHYLKHWREIKAGLKEREQRRLNRYVEGIMKRNREGPTKRREQEEVNASDHTLSSSEEVDRLIEDLGYEDPQSVDQMIENLKVEKDY